MRSLHIVPTDDLFDHTLTDTCLCGPSIELVRDHNGEDSGWLISHMSLDGREHRDDGNQEPGWDLVEAAHAP